MTGTLNLRRLVPDGYRTWYYHEETGLILHNNPERGWVAVNQKEKVINEHEELSEVVDGISGGEVAEPEDVLPLSDDYKHTNQDKEWWD